MNILLTGATGYIGKRLLPNLVDEDNTIYCVSRDVTHINIPYDYEEGQIKRVEADLLKADTLINFPDKIDVAYYLVHSMSSSAENFTELEKKSAYNFVEAMKDRSIKQVIYLSGLVNDKELSKHLKSRKMVEDILSRGNFHLTTLRAGIIVGSGSASFEIIRDLVEKLPIMIAPRWLNTKTQPIAIRDVLNYLVEVKLDDRFYDESYDIGGPDVLSYKEMLLQFAQQRALKRWIIPVPVMTPKLSSYWLYFVTSTSYNLATSLVDSMKIETIVHENRLKEALDVELLTFKEAIDKAINKMEQNSIVSSWKDSMVSGRYSKNMSAFMQVPTYGCFKDERKRKISDVNKTIENIWSLGGKNGWYANQLWRVRGWLDKLVGGVGLRRGRTHPTRLHSGDALDFWRVLYADKSECRLLLFAEMRLPGDAWLEFKIKDDNILYQTATFRPKGLLGRIYWYSILPIHGLIFNGMIDDLSV